MFWRLSLVLLFSACEKEKPDSGTPPADTGPAWEDADGDGYNTSTDCDDQNPYIHPGTREICTDGVDNDCDGSVDGDDSACQHVEDTGEASPVDSDLDGYNASEDCDDDDVAVHPGAAELCFDGIDNDCDGLIDDGTALDAIACYTDTDCDTFGDVSQQVESACTCPAGSTVEHPGGDGLPLWDCDDDRGDVNPDALEFCNGLDDDCDGTTDEPDAVDAPIWYADTDADGFGAAHSPTPACQQPDGYVADDTDCDDTRARANPLADEACICPAEDARSPDDDGHCSGADDDCDGDVDENSAIDAPTWYRDQDEDSYGDPAITALACHSAPTGYVADNTDCDDFDENTWPDAPEYCDGDDDDCDGTVDETDALDAETWYADADGDGFGDRETTAVACHHAPSGYVAYTTGFDCDDDDPAVNPDAWEVCNEIDDDCDGTSDENEARDAATWYADGDGDGYGSSSAVVRCDQPAGYVPISGDCDDGRSDAYPGNTEVHCDGIDNDCDSATIDSGVETCFDGVDDDCDGHDSNGCLFVDSTEVSCPSPGDGSALAWAVAYPVESTEVVGFFAPSAITESTTETCDFTTTVTDDPINHELVFSLAVSGCGTAPRTSNGVEGLAVVVAITTGSPQVFSTAIQQVGDGTVNVADSPSSAFTASVDPFCALAGSTGDGATAVGWACDAAFDGSTLSGSLDVSGGGSAAPAVAADLVALALGSNAVAELAPFSCQVLSGAAGSDIVTHTPDHSLGSDSLALVLPQRWSPSDGKKLSLYVGCTPKTTSHTCIVECSGNGTDSLVEGWILYLDGSLH